MPHLLRATQQVVPIGADILTPTILGSDAVKCVQQHRQVFERACGAIHPNRFALRKIIATEQLHLRPPDDNDISPSHIFVVMISSLN